MTRLGAFVIISVALTLPLHPARGQSKDATGLKRFEQLGAKIVSPREFQQRLHQKRSPAPRFTCNSVTCVCDGVDDCITMVHSNRCSYNADDFICTPPRPGKVSCICVVRGLYGSILDVEASHLAPLEDGKRVRPSCL